MNDPFNTTAPAEPASPIPDFGQSPQDTGGQRFRATIKAGVGFDVPWIVLDYPDIPTAYAELKDSTIQSQLKEVIGTVVGASSVFQQEQQKVAPAPAAPAPARSGAPAQASEPPPGTPPAPGPGWVYKSGFNAAKNKAWSAWMPPRGSSESPVWL